MIWRHGIVGWVAIGIWWCLKGLWWWVKWPWWHDNGHVYFVATMCWASAIAGFFPLPFQACRPHAACVHSEVHWLTWYWLAFFCIPAASLTVRLVVWLFKPPLGLFSYLRKLK